MTDEKLKEQVKEKIVKVLKEAMKPIEYGGDSLLGIAPEVHYPIEDEIADALIAAGIGDISHLTDYYTNELSGAEKIIKRLKDENAEMKARIEKAVKLPCKVGDTIYCINGLYNAELQEWQVDEIAITAADYILYLGHSGTNDFRNETGKYFNMWWFTDREAAEAKLKELQKLQENE